MAKTDICTALEAELDTNTAGRSVRSSTFYVDIGTGSAAVDSSVAGSITMNKPAGAVTTGATDAAQNAFYTLTLTNDNIKTSSIILASVSNGSNTQGTPMVGKIVITGDGAATIQIINKHASAEAFNGTLKIWFLVVRTLGELA